MKPIAVISKILNRIAIVFLVYDVFKNIQFYKKKICEISNYQKKMLARIVEVSNKMIVDLELVDFDGEISKLPILTKNQIQRVRNKFRPNSLFYVESSSGGSTGEPTTVYQSIKYWRQNRAAKFYFYYKITNKLFPKIVKLWGEDEKQRWSFKKVYFKLFRTKVFNTFNASDEEIRKWRDEINKFRPHVIEGYASSLTDFLLINRVGSGDWQPIAVVSSAGVLTPNLYRLIRSCWEKSVIVNRYGSREVGDIAWGMSSSPSELPKLYINSMSHIVETIRENGSKCEYGEVGSIVVTQLINDAFPLIRYKLGDRGVLNVDALGREYISELVGRTVDIFKGPNGERVDGEFFTHLFYGNHAIEAFQIIQSVAGIFINIKCSCSQLDPLVEKAVSDKIGTVLPGVNIVWKYNQEFKPDPSGKVRYTRCDL